MSPPCLQSRAADSGGGRERRSLRRRGRREAEMGEGGLRSLPPTRDERPAARPPSPLPLRGLRLPAAPLMSQARWRVARGLRECGRGRRRASGVAGWGKGRLCGLSWPSSHSPGSDPGSARLGVRTQFGRPDPGAASSHGLFGRVSNGGRGAGRSRAPGQHGGFRPAATRAAGEWVPEGQQRRRAGRIGG